MIRAAGLRRQLDHEQVPQVAPGDEYPEGISYKWMAHASGLLRIALRAGSQHILVCVDEDGGVDQLLFYRVPKGDSDGNPT